MALRLVFGGVAVTRGSEKTFEKDTRIDFFGVGGGFRSPGNAAGVGARVAGVTVSGEGSAFTSDLEAGKFGAVADLLSGDLVGGDADLDVSSGGFAGLDAGEPRGR